MEPCFSSPQSHSLVSFGSGEWFPSTNEFQVLTLCRRLFVPELAGRSLEAVDAIFNLRWWQVGRLGGKQQSEAISERLGHDSTTNTDMVQRESRDARTTSVALDSGDEKQDEKRHETLLESTKSTAKV